jgi:hypothetical protein
MKPRIRMLTLAVKATVGLLVAAAVLIVLGIFNGALDWDLFGPKLQALLYGVFAACVALAAVGVGLTVVLGIQEIVRAFQSVQQHFERDREQIPEAPRSAYRDVLLFIGLGLAVTIFALAGVNHLVQQHRSKVFRRLAAEQMEHFGAKVGALVRPLAAPPRDHVPFEIYDLVKTLDGLTFVERTTLYLPDPKDESAMWGYTTWREYRTEDGFARFFVAKDFEKAMQSALKGAGAELEKLNGQTGFTWYYIVRSDDGKPVAVVRIDGNPRESFREYPMGS